MTVIRTPAAEPPQSYRDPALGCVVTRVDAGDCVAAREGSLLVTVLGSCVSVCLADPGRGLGGMNHFMLPGLREGLFDPQAAVSLAARYGAYAMELLVNRLLQIGADRSRLRAQVFGGASIIRGLGDVGLANIAFARQYLARERIAVTTEDVGGHHARKVAFHVGTAHAQVTVLDALSRRLLGRTEDRFARRVDAVAAAPRADGETSLLF